MVQISIIIPVYNEVNYIKECLDSVFGQDRAPEFEVIAVDDLSDDGTRDVLADYEKKHTDNMVYIPLEEHTGYPGIVRNIGMQYAGGEYMVFIDSDDRIEKNFLNRMYTAAVRNDSDVVSCSYDRFGRNGTLDEDRYEGKNFALNQGNVQALKNLLLAEGTRTNVWGRMYRKSLIEENHIFFPETLHIAEDVYFHHLCIFSAKNYESVPDILYHYRMKEDSIFHDRKADWSGDIVMCLDVLADHLEEEGTLEAVRMEYGSVYYFKAIEELAAYADIHGVSDDKYMRLIMKVRETMRKHFPGLGESPYLSAEQRRTAAGVIGR